MSELYTLASAQSPPQTVQLYAVESLVAKATLAFIIQPASNLTGSFRDESRWGAASELDGTILLYGEHATHDSVVKLQDWFNWRGQKYEITDILEYPSIFLWEGRARVAK
jgi:hypothetical protein